ncbi:GntR family transcriptional regulator [Nostoc sp. MBR 210]|uniref:GntR family transcriptional regulator n=1 Tax=Nostoc spongiaeforme FACHB-130 TaxID=1357510 RepID=A0ABR8FQJ2_9NOSO|nr:GntR family transcriptional regulator [Nostoc spongiaeforme]MBD2593716.1 GntR family transcriptional regulator [Nostoc spongiaeforme FACHB-130]OCQ98909.1 GntR family transcriptional regulator [Nostoc sp. MBR 210]
MNLHDLAANVLQQQRSTPDLIADALREAILRGIFQEGQSLRQDEIATQFGVSRIPVREALRQLEAEGLVTLHLNRGAMVSVLTAAEAQEICEIRSALEVQAIQLAIPKFSTADLEKAALILETTDQTTDAGLLAQLNWEFHAALYTSAERPRLLAMIKNLHINCDRYVRMQMAQMDYQERSQKEHYQLLDACKQRDTKTAVRLLKRHIDTAGEQLVMYLLQKS